MRPVLDVLRALHQAEVRAVVVGGVAVVLHGHPRLTADLDLVLDLTHDNVTRALATLQKQGLRPRLPVAPEQFADPATRQCWQHERNLTVLSLHDPAARCARSTCSPSRRCPSPRCGRPAGSSSSPTCPYPWPAWTTSSP